MSLISSSPDGRKPEPRGKRDHCGGRDGGIESDVVVRVQGWTSRSAQGHTLIHWRCPARDHWHVNGWLGDTDDGIRCLPRCIPDRDVPMATVKITSAGVASPQVRRAIAQNRTPIWIEPSDNH
jgi:hypothetical protein